MPLAALCLEIIESKIQANLAPDGEPREVMPPKFV